MSRGRARTTVLPPATPQSFFPENRFRSIATWRSPPAETQSTSAVEEETTVTTPAAEDFVVPEAVAEAQAQQQEMDDAVHLDQGFDVEQTASTEVLSLPRTSNHAPSVGAGGARAAKIRKLRTKPPKPKPPR